METFYDKNLDVNLYGYVSDSSKLLSLHASHVSTACVIHPLLPHERFLKENILADSHIFMYLTKQVMKEKN